MNFFMVYDIDIHQSNRKQFKNLKFLGEISFKKCVFLHLFNNIHECIIIYIYFRKKPLQYQKGGDFINGYYLTYGLI